MIDFLSRMKILTLVIVSIGLIIYQSTLDSKEPEPKSIRWKDSPLASGYQIQIKQDTKSETAPLLLDAKTDNNWYPIKGLKEGGYLVRTAALSPFGKPVVWSSWRKITIKNREVIEDEIVQPKPEPKPEPIPEPKIAKRSLPPGCKDESQNLEHIKECRGDYILLDLSTPPKAQSYYRHLLDQPNQVTRMRAVRYYRENCNSQDENLRTKLESIRKTLGKRMTPGETRELDGAIQFQKDCTVPEK